MNDGKEDDDADWWDAAAASVDDIDETMCVSCAPYAPATTNTTLLIDLSCICPRAAAKSSEEYSLPFSSNSIR